MPEHTRPLSQLVTYVVVELHYGHFGDNFELEHSL